LEFWNFRFTSQHRKVYKTPTTDNSTPDVSDDSGCTARTSNVEDVRADAHDVVENARELGEHHPDVLGAQRHVNIQQLLHCQRIALPNNDQIT
jgi:hypothetical protein